MTNANSQQAQRGKSLIVLGFLTITILFVLYSRYQDPALITPDAFDSIQRLAYGFYVILLMAFGAITVGLYRFHKQKTHDTQNGLLAIIAKVTWNAKARKIFFGTFVGYGIFFSLTSGTLVYQPEVIFSYHYGVMVPSAHVVPCCDAPGYMPKILVYITEHVGLQIIPINLVLQITVSYLVGLNASIAVSAISISRKQKGFSSIGAATGLFIACPTCVGSFLSIFVGTASGIALSIALTQLQTFFIAVSIPVLLVTPFILAKKLTNPDGSCSIETI